MKCVDLWKLYVGPVDGNKHASLPTWHIFMNAKLPRSTRTLGQHAASLAGRQLQNVQLIKVETIRLCNDEASDLVSK